MQKASCKEMSKVRPALLRLSPTFCLIALLYLPASSCAAKQLRVQANMLKQECFGRPWFFLPPRG